MGLFNSQRILELEREVMYLKLDLQRERERLRNLEALGRQILERLGCEIKEVPAVARHKVLVCKKDKKK